MRFAVVALSSHGGLLQYGAQLSDGLAALGHNVRLIAPAGSEVEGRLKQAKLHNILIEPVTQLRISPPDFLRYQISRIAVAIRLMRSLAKLTWEVRSGYDVVMLQDVVMLPYVIAARLMTQLPNGPRIVLVIHNVIPFDRWGSNRVFVESHRICRRLQRLYKYVDAVIVHGESSAAQFRERWSATQVIEIPHGNESIFGEPSTVQGTPGHVLFFGDWRKVKGLPTLMDAFDLLVRTHPGATLTVAGTPAPTDFDDRSLRRWAATRQNVRLIDKYVPLDEVPSLIGSCEVVVLPYIASFQSGVLHLAMSLGRPVVASRVGELGRVVEKYQCGTLVPPGNAVALAGALAEMIDNRSLAQEFGRAGYSASVDELSWERIAETIERALK